MNYKIKIIDSLNQIPQDQWNALAKGAGPFLRYEFLHTLETSGCCSNETGWQACHIIIEQENSVVGLVPGYLKTHSYGEYVFDHSWADAYHRYGLEYYPKWISAIPFTPVTGRRMLLLNSVKPNSELLTDIERALQHYVDRQYGESLSSLHWLFTTKQCHHLFKQSPSYLERHAVQFQWHNYQYTVFEDFLRALTSRKRKDIKKLRNKHKDIGITYSHRTGEDIDSSTIAFFSKCYESTYLKRSGHSGYLSPDFFYLLAEKMRDEMLIVTAYEHHTPVASALFLYDKTGLYGRYWGALKKIDGLHFSCCYFEGIEFAINNALPLFNPGTQGEHKLLRGFEPIFCNSHHRLFEPNFHHAVAQFLHRETEELSHYFNQAKNALPFNEAFTPKLKTSVTARNDDTNNHNEK